ncbi:MAG: hypothetical protein K5754_04650 [Butyrivibrio sp.]|nr:hypothetical protein [Butyrivibrio sp.]
MRGFLSYLFTKLYYQKKYNKTSKDGIQYYKAFGVPYLDDYQMADEIKDALEKKIPYCIGKIGGNECDAVVSQIVGYKKYVKKSYSRLCHFAGFFPNEFDKDKFAEYFEIQTHAIGNLNMLVWYRKPYEELLIKKFANNNLNCVKMLASWAQELPWTRELAGYRVVVVHPYAELIEKQYKRRELLFGDSAILPRFDLRVVKAVQSIADNKTGFSSWKDALNSMYEEVIKEDFDIALIGCGAYGLPLASMIKDFGKIGVHMGGDLQMLFGIRGKRWDDMPESNRWYNNAWVRPGEEYKPEGFDSIEDGCYW